MHDDVIILPTRQDDDDQTVFQTEEDRRKLEKDLFGDTEDETEIDTTLKLVFRGHPYWRQVFG